jgi:hypothetical protein
MESDLLAYLVPGDDPSARERVAEQLRRDPDLARQVQLLAGALTPLEADKEPPAPPGGLVGRTIGRVAEYICGQKQRADVQPVERVVDRSSQLAPEELRALVETMDHGGESTPSRWQPADIAVVAAVLLLAVGLGLAAMPHLRHRQNVQACQNQMREIHQALEGYSQVQTGHYPRIDEQPPHDTAESYLNMLQDAGFLFPGTKGVCPAALDRSKGYAYSLGFRTDDGQLVGLSRDLGPSGLDMLPILADRPSTTDGDRGMSPDHRYGQNVLFLGGNVRFCTTTQAGIDRDDIYKNKYGEVARGVNCFDTVLGFGADRP